MQVLVDLILADKTRVIMHHDRQMAAASGQSPVFYFSDRGAVEHPASKTLLPDLAKAKEKTA
jgi:hypothetical protein